MGGRALHNPTARSVHLEVLPHCVVASPLVAVDDEFNVRQEPGLIAREEQVEVVVGDEVKLK